MLHAPFLAKFAALALISVPLCALDSQETSGGEADLMRLPVCAQSLPEAKAIPAAATLNIQWDGRVLAGDDLLHDPSKSENREAIRAWLKLQAGKMKKLPLESRSGLGDLSDGLLLLRCDETAPFVHVQNLMMDCTRPDTAIWRLNLASLYVDGEGDKRGFLPGRLDVSLLVESPSDATDSTSGTTESSSQEDGRGSFELSIKVLAEGDKLVTPLAKPWSGKADEHFYHDPESRKLKYSRGPRIYHDYQDLRDSFQHYWRLQQVSKRNVPPLLIIHPGKGTTVHDVVAVMDLALEANFASPGFMPPE